ncbi:hypothetical protein GCM10011331_13240 [Flavimobilis marinus]|uniref:T3SS peptide-binding chaperone domain-containing protein n=1 Tax=Flavimobilis marinus TaxID=285351 RepID=A0A1I2G2G2_9MICO|nr:hypothetical protein [Flavimobilis marinus]GHG50522.1 hypothetical protein GCM10011331_13240 [Flavimobilis marinus]SFF10956.1 hypothetical protein SAMN04488035_1644 [Flavimobilis marinus]
MFDTVVHVAKTGAFTTAEPVGIWREDGAFYPPEHEHRGPAGHKAIYSRPPSISWREWAEWKVKTSPSWRTPGDFGVGAPPDAPLDKVYEAVRQSFLSSAQAKTVEKHEGPDIAIPPVPPHWRLVNVESWWIASELVRRHPELVVYEMHPGGGQYDVLSVRRADTVGEGSMREAHVMLNRQGTIQVHAGAEFDTTPVATWMVVLGEESPHHWVKKLETVAGFGSPPSAPATTRRSLAFRIIAQLLTTTMHDRDRWDARNEFYDSSGSWGSSLHGWIDTFPLAAEDARQAAQTSLPHEVATRFWGILRDDTVVAMLSTDGWGYVNDRRIDLMAAYKASGRRLLPVVSELLAAVPPSNSGLP